MEQWGQTTVSSKTFVPRNHSSPENGNAVLRELFELLEDYAPGWYTEELHNRAAAVLGELMTHSAVC
jgi:hypothetical protein